MADPCPRRTGPRVDLDGLDLATCRPDPDDETEGFTLEQCLRRTASARCGHRGRRFRGRIVASIRAIVQPRNSCSARLDSRQRRFSGSSRFTISVWRSCRRASRRRNPAPGAGASRRGHCRSWNQSTGAPGAGTGAAVDRFGFVPADGEPTGVLPARGRPGPDGWSARGSTPRGAGRGSQRQAVTTVKPGDGQADDEHPRQADQRGPEPVEAPGWRGPMVSGSRP